MPLPEKEFDFEYMNHPSNTPTLGGPAKEERCPARSAEAHSLPEFVSGNRWACTREKGHLGRHEAGIDGGKVMLASWADKPE